VKIINNGTKLLLESSDVREIRTIYEAEFKICYQFFRVELIIESLCHVSYDDGLGRLYICLTLQTS
jgi:hypothetical protein